MLFKNVLVPYDESEHAVSALHVALGMVGDDAEAQVHVVTVVSIGAIPGPSIDSDSFGDPLSSTTPLEYDSVMGALLHRVRADMEGMINDAKDGASCKIVSTAIIAGGHTDFRRIIRNGEVLLDKMSATAAEEDDNAPQLTLRRVYDFALTAPLDEIRFILETARLNKAAAERSFTGDYGHGLGKMLRGNYEHKIMGDSVFSHILSYTSGACDARMAGAMIPVMSNSGSGNQGISATLPVVVYAEENGKTEEELIRALMLSHLTVIYIKQSLGRLSALCGCVVAATGSSCGITWLMGGGYKEVTYAVQNMIANLTGMICDGAKPSCALKVTTGVSTAVLSAIMAMEGRTVTSVEGIIDEDVDQSIRNLTKIGSKGMNETDRLVLDIMTSK